MRGLMYVLTTLQAVLAARVLLRFLTTASGVTIRKAAPSSRMTETITVIVPVLDEADRLGPCLDGLMAQSEVVREILVVDGGSVDGTRALVEKAMAHDSRIRLVDASPVPPAINGKAWGLMAGRAAASPDPQWILTIDADVRPSGQLACSLLAQAEREMITVLSVATAQKITGAALGLLHPSMLATLVYRFGIPGSATTHVHQVQANGQCFFIRRDVLDTIGGFSSGLDSVCEDVTLARRAAAAGFPVGFYESESLVSTEMHASARDAWQNWPRSLPVRDAMTRWSSLAGFAEIVLVQGLPLWITPAAIFTRGVRHPLAMVNVGLVMARMGVLAGMSRAYVSRPWSYALSPLLDLPVAFQIIRMAGRRSHRWRGRAFTPGAKR